MFKDQYHRIINPKTGKGIPFSCENNNYCTDIKNKESFRHLPNRTLGSALKDPLFFDDHDTLYSLWLEHVINKKDSKNKNVYWLMWYDGKGFPLIPFSGVFSKDDLKKMVGMLADHLGN